MKHLLFLILMCAGTSVFAQDIMYFRDGDVDEVKVLQVDEHTVSYKKFANLDGPTYSINKSVLQKVRYETGDEDDFSTYEKPANLGEPVKLPTATDPGDGYDPKLENEDRNVNRPNIVGINPNILLMGGLRLFAERAVIHDFIHVRLHALFGRDLIVQSGFYQIGLDGKLYLVKTRINSSGFRALNFFVGPTVRYGNHYTVDFDRVYWKDNVMSFGVQTGVTIYASRALHFELDFGIGGRNDNRPVVLGGISIGLRF